MSAATGTVDLTEPCARARNVKEPATGRAPVTRGAAGTLR
jgi:hypothetical protein